MAEPYSEDLFEGTKMTFGEHLEELRVCLFRAVLGLIIGFLIGLGLAKHVVRLVQVPLRHALEEYYSVRTVTRIRAAYPNATDAEVKRLEKLIRDRNLTFELVYAERGQLEQALKSKLPELPELSDVGSRVVEDPDLPFPQEKTFVPLRLWKPLSPKITALGTEEPFMIWLKAGFVTGAVLASPYVFWQLWLFVAAGLYPHEKRYVYVFLPISAGLFWSGVLLAFFVVFRYVLRFLLQFNVSMDIEAEPRITEWISMVLMLPLGFGIAFQLPLVMLFANRLGFVEVDKYIEHWRIAVVVIAFLSMILTPADPISMILMGSPLIALYFLGIAFCKWMPKGRNPFGEAFEP